MNDELNEMLKSLEKVISEGSITKEQIDTFIIPINEMKIFTNEVTLSDTNESAET